MTELTDSQLREAARQQYASDDIEIAGELSDDHDPILEGVSRGEDGAFVLAWVFVRYDDAQARDLRGA